MKKSSRTYKDVEREVSQVPQIDHCHPICSKLFSSAKFFKLFFPNQLDVLNIIFQSSVIVLLQVLGFRWYALNDKQFKLTSVNLNFQYYYEVFLKQRAQISPAIAHS